MHHHQPNGYKEGGGKEEKDTRRYTESCGGAGAIGRVVCFSATLAGVGPFLLGFTTFTAEGNLQNYIQKSQLKLTIINL